MKNLREVIDGLAPHHPAREQLAELSRCLKYADCSECGSAYYHNPHECFEANHLEALEVIREAGL